MRDILPRFFAAVACAAAVAAPVDSNAQVQPAAALAPRPLDVWIMDVGQGACIYVDCPNPDAAMLVDCGTNRRGPRTDASQVASWVNDHLALKAFNSLVITHAHTDHYSLLASGIIDANRVDQAFLGGTRPQYSGSGALSQINAFLNGVPNHADTVHAYAPKVVIEADASFRCAPATVDVLTASVAEASPANAYESRENANSVVLRVSHAGRAIVLPGDAEDITQTSALENAAAKGINLNKPTVMVSSHHGSRTHGSNENDPWRKTWKPQITAFSAQIRYRHRHPKCDTVNGYAAYAASTSQSFHLWCGETNSIHTNTYRKKLLSTYDNGHILLRFTSAGVKTYCQVPTPACNGALDASMLPPLNPGG